jgi:hypothetical protein
MKIRKELKNATFVYDEEKKSFYLSGKEGGFIELNKICAFAFMRFVVRMAQRNWLRDKKSIDKTIEDVVNSENLDHPDQIKFL